MNSLSFIFGLLLSLLSILCVHCVSVLRDSRVIGDGNADFPQLSQQVNLLEVEYQTMKQAFLNFKEHTADLQRAVDQMRLKYNMLMDENQKLSLNLSLVSQTLETVVAELSVCRNETSSLKKEMVATKSRISHLEDNNNLQAELEILARENRKLILDLKSDHGHKTNESACCLGLRVELNATNNIINQMEKNELAQNEQLQKIATNAKLMDVEVQSLVNGTAEITERLDITEDNIRQGIHQSTYLSQLIHLLREDVKILKNQTHLQIQEPSRNTEEYGFTACAQNNQLPGLQPMAFQGVINSYGVNGSVLDMVRSTGVFKCERSGLYLIFLTVKSTSVESMFSIYKNDQYLVEVSVHDSLSTYGHLTFPTASGTTVVHMDIGDEVKVIPRHNTEVFGLHGGSETKYHDTCITIVKV